MSDPDWRDTVIQELADAFVEDEIKKDDGKTRFNGATGTLIASNTFINYALSHIDNERFTKGAVYQCSQVQDDCIRIIADNGKEVRVSINDADFSFKINPMKRKKKDV